MRRRPDDSEKVGDKKYQLDGAVAKEHRSQNAVESPQSQLDTVRTTFDSFHKPLPNFTERMKTVVMDGSRGIFEYLQQTRKLIKKQRDTMILTVKTELKAENDFLCSLESNLSRPGPSF